MSGNIMLATSIASDVDECPEDEWQARVDLALAYRAFEWLGITDLIHTHISIRVPGRHDQFLQLPYGMMFHEARASDMLKCDTQGNILSDHSGLGISRGGFYIHSAIHSAREDAACIMHVHSEATIAVSGQKTGLLPLSQHALRFYDRIGYLDYCGFFDTDEKRARIAVALGDAQVLMLRNHGPLIVGSTLWECFSRTYYLERACRMQVKMQSASRDIEHEMVWPSQADAEDFALACEDPSQGVALREWAAIKRLLDAKGADYAA